MTNEEVVLSVLRANRLQRLEWYEKEIEKRGRALAQIFLELKNDSLKPYLLTHDSFESYCRERWNMTPRRVQQITAAESVREMLLEGAPDLEPQIAGMKERHLREIATVPPERRVDLVRTVSQSPARITTGKIKRAKAQVVSDGESELKFCPTCGQPIK